MPPTVARQSRQSHRPLLAAAAGYAAILIILFHRLLTGGVLSPAAIVRALPPFGSDQNELRLHVNRNMGDVWMQMIPWQFEQYQHQGGIPMWNPRIYCGFPIYANGQAELLNPTHWIYYFVNPDPARGPMAALRLWVSALVMFILLCRFRVGATGAFLGGAVWILSSFNIRWLLWPHTDSSLVLPILILALDCFLSRPTARRWALAALSGLLLALSGHPGTQIMVGVVAGVFALARLTAQWSEGVRWRALGLRALGCGAAAVVALAGGAAAILPLVEEVRGSYELAQINRGSNVLPLKALWLFIMPNIFGWPRSQHDYFGPLNYNEAACWLGLVALALALAAAVTWLRGCWRKPDESQGRRYSTPSPVVSTRHPLPEGEGAMPRWTGGFAILLVAVSLPLAFGLLAYVPVISSSHFGRATSFNRMFLGVEFGGAILAAMGADQVLRTGPRLTALLAFWFTLAALVCGSAVWFTAAQLQYLLAICHQTWDVFWLDSSVRVLGGLILGVLACGVLGSIGWSARRGRPATPNAGGEPVAPLWRTLLVMVILADLLWVAWDYNPIESWALVHPPLPSALRDIIASAGDGRVAATDLLLTPNLASVYGFRDVRGYDLPKSMRLGYLLSQLRLQTLNLTLLPRARLAPVMDSALAAWLDRTSVRFLVSQANYSKLDVGSPPASPAVATHAPPKIAAAGPRPRPRSWPQVAQLTGCRVYANPNAYPRAYMPVEASPGSPSDGLGALLDPTGDLRQKSIYETPPEASPAASPVPHTMPAAGSVRITTDRDEEVILDVQTAAGGLVVLSDRMAPGWEVTVDGVGAPAHFTNFLFRGVLVPAGHHTVRWSYRVPGLLADSAVSLVTILFLIGLVVRGGRNDAPHLPGAAAVMPHLGH